MKLSIVIYLSVLLCCMISLIWKRRKTVTAIPQVKGFEFSARWPLVAWAWACCLCLNFFLYLCVSLFSSWPLGLAAGTVFSSCWQLWQLLSFVPKLIPVLSSAFHGCPVLAGHHPHPHYHPLLYLPRDPYPARLLFIHVQAFVFLSILKKCSDKNVGILVGWT